MTKKRTKKVRPIDDRIKETEAHLKKLKQQKAVATLKGTEEEKIIQVLRKAGGCIEKLIEEDFESEMDLDQMLSGLETIINEMITQAGVGDDEAEPEDEDEDEEEVA